MRRLVAAPNGASDADRPRHRNRPHRRRKINRPRRRTAPPARPRAPIVGANDDPSNAVANGTFPSTAAKGIRYHAGRSEAPPVFFPSDLKDIVGFLCGQLPGDEGIVEPEPKGTGFFLDASPVRQGHIYLVTARHVVRDLQRAGPTFLRVSKGYPNQRGAGLNYLPLANEGWLYHQDPNVDVAVYS